MGPHANVKRTPALPIELGHPEGPRLKRSKIGLDDSDADTVQESEDKVPFDLSEHLQQTAEAPQPKVVTEDPGSDVVKRRIRGKRPSDGSDFPARALVSKAEHDRLKGIEAEKDSKVRRLNKAAMQVAELAFA